MKSFSFDVGLEKLYGDSKQKDILSSTTTLGDKSYDGKGLEESQSSSSASEKLETYDVTDGLEDVADDSISNSKTASSPANSNETSADNFSDSSDSHSPIQSSSSNSSGDITNNSSNLETSSQQSNFNTSNGNGENFNSSKSDHASNADSMGQNGNTTDFQKSAGVSGNANGNNASQDVNVSGVDGTGSTGGNRNIDTSSSSVMKTTVNVTTTSESGNSMDFVVEDLEEYKCYLTTLGLSDVDIDRVLNNQVTLDELMKEIDTDPDKKRKVMEAYYLQAYQLDVSDMGGLNDKIDDITVELRDAVTERRNIDSFKEYVALMKIINCLQNGTSLENALNSEIVAWQYEDENGNVCYVFDDPYVSGDFEGIIYEGLTYEKMYGETDNLKKLRSVLTESNGGHVYDYSDEQISFVNSFFDEYSSEQENYLNELEQLDNKIAVLQQELAQYQYIESYITDTVNYYMTYINPYITEDDFSQNSILNQEIIHNVDKIVEEHDVPPELWAGEGAKSYVDVSLDSKRDVVDIIGYMINDGPKMNYGRISSNNADFDFTTFDSETREDIISYYDRYVEFVTDEEISVFNYIYNKEGVDAAYQYLIDISYELDNRWLADRVQKDEEFAHEHPVLASLASIVITPFEGLSAMAHTLNFWNRVNDIKIRRIDVYSSGDIYRQKVAYDIAQYNEMLSFIYSTGMSMADSVSLIGVSVLTGGTATPFLSATLMGSRAYVSTLNEALDRGLSDGAAVSLAFSSAVVESAMESYSVGHLLNLETKLGTNTINLVSTIAEKVKNPRMAKFLTKFIYITASALSQGVAEGEEEFATEILNYVFDRVINDAIFKNGLSNYSVSIQNYLNMGYTEDEAFGMTMNDFKGQVIQAFIGGFASGICFGAFSGISTTYSVSKQISNNIIEDYNNGGNGNSVRDSITGKMAKLSDAIKVMHDVNASSFAMGIANNYYMKIAMEEYSEDYNKTQRKELFKKIVNGIKNRFNGNFNSSNVDIETNSNINAQNNASVEEINSVTSNKQQLFLKIREGEQLLQNGSQVQSENNNYVIQIKNQIDSILNDWNSSLYQMLADDLIVVKRLTQAVQLEDGSFKVYPIDSTYGLASILANYMQENNLTFEHNVAEIKGYLKEVFANQKTQLSEGTLQYYYGRPSFFLERCMAIMNGLVDMKESSYFTVEEIKTITDVYNEANSVFEESILFLNELDLKTMTYEQYDQAENIYLYFKQIEDELSGLSEKSWKSFFKENNAKFVHSLTGDLVESNVMEKMCVSLCTDKLMGVAYGHVGYTYDVDMKNIVAICEEDVGSWFVDKNKFIELGLSSAYTKDRVYFEYGYFSKLLSPEHIESKCIERNIECNGEILNYSKDYLYNETYISNANHDVKPTAAFYTDEATDAEIQQMKILADKQGIELIKLSLEEARQKYYDRQNEQFQSFEQVNQSVELDSQAQEELIEKIRMIREYTDNDVPEGYYTISEYKKSFVKDILDTTNQLNVTVIYELARDPVMLTELIGTDSLNNLYVKNLVNFSKTLVPALSAMEVSDFNRLFNIPTMVDYINSLSANKLGKILSYFKQSEKSNISWITCDTIINKIINLDVEDFYSFVTGIGWYSSEIEHYIKFGGDVSNYLKLLDAIKTKFYTKEVLLNNISYKDQIEKLIGEFSLIKNDQTQSMLNAISNVKNECEKLILNAFISSSDVEIQMGSYGAIEIPVDPRYKYYNLSVEVDGHDEIIGVSQNFGCIDIRYSLINKVYYASAALEGKLKIKDISVNLKKSNLVLTESMGLRPGLNEVILLFDGVEKPVVVNSSFAQKDLNFDFEHELDNINDVQVKSVKSIESMNIDVDDPNALYHVSYEIAGKKYDAYMKTYPVTFESDLGENTLNIDDYISRYNLFGVENIEVNKATHSEIKEKFPFISKYSSSSEIYTDSKFGGNQSDIRTLIQSKVNNFSLPISSIDSQKAAILDHLIDKYFPGATDMQKINLATHYAHGGCCWMAVANAFATYIGSIEDGRAIFKNKIGFDLTVSDDTHSSYNLEAIAFDMYLSYFSNTYQGDIQRLLDSNVGAGISAASFDSQIVSYFVDRGIDVKSDTSITLSEEHNLDNELIQRVLNNKDGFSILSASAFDMKFVDGVQGLENSSDQALTNAKIEKNIVKDVGSHSMLVTGIDDNMNLLVSSWSKQYQFLSKSLLDYRALGKDANASIWTISFSIPTDTIAVADTVVGNDTTVFEGIDYDDSKTQLLRDNQKIAIVKNNLEKVIATINQKSHNVGGLLLEKYLMTGNANLITKDNNCRSYVQSLSRNDFTKALNIIIDETRAHPLLKVSNNLTPQAAINVYNNVVDKMSKGNGIYNYFEYANYVMNCKKNGVDYFRNDQYLSVSTQLEQLKNQFSSSKKYLSLKTKTEIFNYFGTMSDLMYAQVINAIKDISSQSFHPISGYDLEKIKDINYLNFLLAKPSQNIVNYLSSISYNGQVINLNDKQQIINYFEKSFQGKFISKLTVKEVLAIYEYTVGSGTVLRYLTGEKNGLRIKDTVVLDNIIEGLDSAILKFGGLRKNMILYRGDDFRKLSLWKGWKVSNFSDLQSYVGKVVTCDTYMSTGVSEKGSFQGEAQWRIKAPIGTKGMYINDLSHYFDEDIEFEYLIKRGSKFRIDRVYKVGGTTYIDAKVVE